MKRYEEYKAVDLPWLSEIPSHWELRRSKTIFNVINERSETGEEELLSVSSKYGVVKRSNIDVTMFKAESYKGYKVCNPDDLVINSLWAWQYGLGFSQYNGIISTAYGVYRLKNKEKCLPKYFNYLYRGTDYHWEMRVRSKGIWKSRYQLHDSSFLSMLSIIPPYTEQEKIVKFLDWKISKINKYIKAKKRQIELLKELKQAEINRAVTKGLDPTVPIKDSGVSWLGEIPVHWGTKKIKYFALLKSGTNLTSEQIEGIGKYPVYGGNGLRGYYHSFSDKGDYVLIGRQGALCGNINYAKGKFWATEHAVICYPLIEFNILWFGELLRCMNLNQYSIASAQPGLAVEKIKNLKLPNPSITEQKEISTYISKIIIAIDKLLSKINFQIIEIEEFKTKLISDVVTGKIDVRDIEVPEHYETDETVQEDLEEVIEDLENID